VPIVPRKAIKPFQIKPLRVVYAYLAVTVERQLQAIKNLRRHENVIERA